MPVLPAAHACVPVLPAAHACVPVLSAAHACVPVLPAAHASNLTRHFHSAGLLVWARFVMAGAKGRHEVEAAVQEQNTAQEEMPDIQLLPAAARSDQVDEEE